MSDKFSKDHLPAGDWSRANHTRIVQYVKMDEPFTVVTANGMASCASGYLALDSRGYPYPIDEDEFDGSYEPAKEPIVPPVPLPDPDADSPVDSPKPARKQVWR
jgi:hypothetical protein